ncbi:MAG: hypothetical protein ACFB15_14275, partial [Cyclobacteriaceae bacterium]
FGGLLRATVRYFNAINLRPGLPKGVAALVTDLQAESLTLELVNLSVTETRKLVVQAGAFGEHSFTEVREDDGTSATPVDDQYFTVELPPANSITLQIGLERFVNQPSYAFPWHQGKIPVH